MPKTIENVISWEVDEKVSYEDWLSEVLSYWPTAYLDETKHQILAFLTEEFYVVAVWSIHYGSWLITSKYA